MQRQGIGRALLAELEAELARRGASSLYLEVRESNIPARRIYEQTDLLSSADAEVITAI